MIIGHASIDENGKSRGGNAGDQTGKEVTTRSYYSKGWNCVLRAKDVTIAEKMAVACEQGCKNNNIGYDQGNRNSLFIQAKNNNYDLSKITTPCECDCSSFMAVCAECAGVRVIIGSNAPTTSSMVADFTRTGLFEALTDSKYLTSDKYLKRGDILVKAGSHTVMALGNGTASTITNKKTYEVGKEYTTDANLYIRYEPYGEKIKHTCITANAREHADFDEYGYAILKQGTKVTCKAVKELTGSTWLLIPSGWICGREQERIYVK